MIFCFRCRISPYFLNPKLRIIQTWPLQSMSDLLSTWLLKLLCSFCNHLYFFCQNRRGSLCTILRIYCQEIKSVVNSISYCGTTVSALLLNFLFIFLFIYLFIFFTSVLNNFPEKWTWLTLSKLTRIDYSTLRFSFSIAQH